MIELTQSERTWMVLVPRPEQELLTLLSREIDATFHYVPGQSIGPEHNADGERVGMYLTASCYDKAGNFFRPKFVVSVGASR